MTERFKVVVLKTTEQKCSVGSNPTLSAILAQLRYDEIMTSTPIKCWHGSQRWSGSPQVQPARKGCYECGPGLYLTTRRTTAAKYAKGAGSLVMIDLDPGLRLLEDTTFTRAQMQEALDSLPRLRRRKQIEEDLDRAVERHPNGQLMACYLVNLCVNHEALAGDNGPALARWLTDNGVDASLESKSGTEEWLIVFNPKIILKSRKLTAAEADKLDWELDKVSDQVKAHRASLNTAPPAAAPSRPRMG